MQGILKLGLAGGIVCRMYVQILDRRLFITPASWDAGFIAANKDLTRIAGVSIMNLLVIIYTPND